MSPAKLYACVAEQEILHRVDFGKCTCAIQDKSFGRLAKSLWPPGDAYPLLGFSFGLEVVEHDSGVSISDN